MNKILVSKEGLLGVRVDLSDFCLPRRFCIFDSAGVVCRFGDACLQKRDTQLRVRESCALSSTLCRKDHGRRILFAPPLSAAAARASFGIRFRRGQGRRIALRPAQTLKGSLQVELHAHFEHADRRAEAGVSPLSAQRWASVSWPISSSVRAEETCAYESVCAENALHALFGITRSRFCC